ncbi:hypothetical protein Tco_1526452, partial [Tanacetum coccineum]
KDEDMLRVNDLEGDEVVIESEVADKDVNLSIDEVTLAQALAALKSTKVQKKGMLLKSQVYQLVLLQQRDFFHEQEQEQEQETTPIVSSQQSTQVKDKGNGKMVEEEPVKKMSKKELLKLNEELAFKLQAEEDKEERLAREKAQRVKEANIAWDDIQAKVEADYQRKHFAAKRAEEKRNRPLTKALQRSFMCTYLKNMEGWKPTDLKNKSFANIQELFDKRAGNELEQDNAKKQNVDEDKETAELQSLIKIVPDKEEVAIDVVPLATKPPTIVD